MSTRNLLKRTANGVTSDKFDISGEYLKKEDLIQRIVSIFNSSNTFTLPESVLQELQDCLEKQNYQNPELITELASHRAQHLLNEMRLSEAIATYELILKVFPYYLTLQINWGFFLTDVKAKFEELALMHPEDSEVGKIYLKLNGLGALRYTDHILGLRHFVVTAQWDPATNLAIQILQASPALIEVGNLVEMILANQYSAELAELRQNVSDPLHTKKRQSNTNPALALRLIVALRKANSYIAQENYVECLKICRQQISESMPFNFDLIDFYFLEAVCLDYMEKIDEALETFARIQANAPDLIRGRRSYEITLIKYLSKALTNCDASPKSPIVSKYFTVFYNLHYVPINLLEKHLHLLCDEKGQESQIKELILNRAKLFPFDNQTITLLKTFGEKLQDKSLLLLADHTYDECLLRRPWDLELLNLFNGTGCSS